MAKRHIARAYATNLRLSVDKYCISNASMQDAIANSFNIASSKVHGTRIPVSESFFEQVPRWTNATSLTAYATNLRLSAFICGQILHIECSMQDAIANSFNIASSQVHGTRFRVILRASPSVD